MPKQTIEIEVPEGYELTGEYRRAKSSDIILNRKNNAELWVCLEESTGCYLILRRVKQWRPATVEDAVRAIRGEKVKARGRYFPEDRWIEFILTGYDSSETSHWLSATTTYAYCEVLCD